ncbi:hypothetical protein [Tautonia rosea]|uniref:hypothetical protein n=1 Tax=Tautonia rosea TaxID=2728037 RepID=UPI001F48BEF2|nr:hypothetical protein [Tautonia rosea]
MMKTSMHDDHIAHCVAKVVELVSLEAPDRRALLQLGYNLGRLSELTGLGRGPFWDSWKAPVSDWDQPSLRSLAQQLQMNPRCLPSSHPEVPTPSE